MSRLVAGAALALAACAAKPPVPTAATATTAAPALAGGHLSVFVTSELKGYLGPCGCSENMRGGIARTAQQLGHARQVDGPVLYIDSGDALFGEPQIAEASVGQQERKARAMAEAMKAMGLAARATGPLDDARGEAFRRALALPELPRDGVLVIDRVGVVEGATSAQLEERAGAARARGAAFVLGLWRTSYEVAIREPPSANPGLDLALAVQARDELSGEQNKLGKGALPLVQLQTKGRSVLKLDLYFHGSGRFELLRGAADVEREGKVLDQRIELLRAQVNEPMIADALKAMRKQKLAELISRREAMAEAPLETPKDKNAFTVRFVPMESSFPEDPKVKALVTAYDRDVGLLNVEWAKQHGKPCPAPARGEPAYVGNPACLDCHEDAFTSWNASKHAHSYETLQHVGKEHHLDCIGCHVTGWQKPGGVCRIDQTANRQAVGCEMCHGPGSNHVEDPDNVRVPKGDSAQTCTGCHDRENSPHFDFDRYVKEIIAPGHGQPAANGPRPKKKSG